MSRISREARRREKENMKLLSYLIAAPFVIGGWAVKELCESCRSTPPKSAPAPKKKAASSGAAPRRIASSVCVDENCITVTGFKHYYGLNPFAVGMLLCCEKEPRNPYDSKAIRCTLPGVGTVGYIANSPATAAEGSMCADGIYAAVPDRFYARVLFITRTKVICRIERTPRGQLEQEFRRQPKVTV